MSIHKLSAGSGYDYLTRQVAALDATEKGHVGLASYYTERGESPGSWIGSGIAGTDGLSAGDAVTAEQMRALFGAGMHPLATQRLAQLEAADLTTASVRAAIQLGAPFKVYASEVSPFRVEVAKRIATQHRAGRQLGDDSVFAALRAQVRTEVAREFFRKEHGRNPIDAREIAATLAKESRPRTQTVAGYDLTFSPVKFSVNAVGGRRPAGRCADRTSAPGCRAGCAELHRTLRTVHPARTQRGPAGQCDRPGRGGVHSPPLPSRRPGPGRTNGIRIPCRTSARNTFPIPAMRLWSSKAATPHSVTRRQDLHFLCSGLAYRLSGFHAHSASFSAHKGAGPFPPYANQVHPERGLRRKQGDSYNSALRRG